VLAERIDTVLAGYGAITDADVARVRELPRNTIYNDWTTGNHLVDAQGTVRGLIDFDSVIEAPRIVDFQNALAYVLVGAPSGPETGLVTAFAQGYLTVLAPPPEELALVHAVALDRIAELIVRRIAAAHREPIRLREVLAIRLIELFCWLSEDRTRLAHGYTF
jgi:Ser/Thr protein kinase RdoA (MazF antagonist)